MSDEEIRAWSLLIAANLNELESTDFLCQKQLIEGIEEYIRNGAVSEKPPHQKKRIHFVDGLKGKSGDSTN